MTEKVKPGSIVLFHNAALHTPEALPGILEKLQGEGFRFVPISELIYKDNYAIDQAGKQYQLTGDSKEAGQAQNAGTTENTAAPDQAKAE